MSTGLLEICRGVKKINTVEECVKLVINKNYTDMQRGQRNINFCAIVDCERRTSVRDLHVALKIPNIYVYTAELCRKQVELTLYRTLKM
jgi:hypothetical protein